MIVQREPIFNGLIGEPILASVLETVLWIILVALKEKFYGKDTLQLDSKEKF